MNDKLDSPQTTIPQLSELPEIPALNERWTMRRKAGLVLAVRSGRIPLEEACRVYKLSCDEFRTWERNIDRYGIPGLRTTRYQIYRDQHETGRR